MKLPKSKKGIKFVTIYILLLIVAITFALFMIGHKPSKSEFVGVYIVFLTLPWSIFVSGILIYFRMMDSISMAAKLLLLGICAIPNAVILYHIGAKIERAKNKKGGTSP